MVSLSVPASIPAPDSLTIVYSDACFYVTHDKSGIHAWHRSEFDDHVGRCLFDALRGEIQHGYEYVVRELYDLIPSEVPVIDDARLAEQTRVGRNMRVDELTPLTLAYFPQLARLEPAPRDPDYAAGLEAFLDSQHPIDDVDIDAMYAAQMEVDEARADAERAEAEIAGLRREQIRRENGQAVRDAAALCRTPVATVTTRTPAGEFHAFVDELVLGQAEAMRRAIS
ncbi:MAG TPA: hypothetical protein VF624_01340 [Tepidisphaeraceae bacterium]|jgi:hypothetical protein